MKSRKIALILLILAIVGTSGCYYRREIDESEVGLILPDGVTIAVVVGPGRYTDMSMYADLKEIDTSAKTFEWTDPDVVTSDKQQVGFTVGISYRRRSDPESIKEMWTTFRSECVDDSALQTQVANRTARIVKNVSAQFSLDQMLGVSNDDTKRTDVANLLQEQLGIELLEVGVELLDIGINNISPSNAFRARLEEKANAAAQAEIAKQRTIELQEKLIQERAQTDIGLEIARRDRLVQEEKNKVYQDNPMAFELAKIEAMADVFGKNDKLIFIPTDGNLNLFMGGGMLPID